MKVFIAKDEWYPVYTVSEFPDFGEEREISQAEYEEYAKIIDAFDKLQEKLHKLYKE